MSGTTALGLTGNKQKRKEKKLHWQLIHKTFMFTVHSSCYGKVSIIRLQPFYNLEIYFHREK